MHTQWVDGKTEKNVRARIVTQKVLDGKSSNKEGRDYFAARYHAQRLLWETKARGKPLPFEDADTKDSGGTFINGLNLPLSVLRKLYWENAIRIYDNPT